MNCQTIRESIDTAPRRAGYSGTIHAHLDGCADCRRHASETSSLLALLNAQPRVEAPADFDFRLRARIARAQSEPQVAAGLLANLERFWTKSFSLGQAATAMAAIIVALTASTFYFTNPNEVAKPGGTMVTTVKAPVETAITSIPNAAQPVRAGKGASAQTFTASNRLAKAQPLQSASLTTAVASAVSAKAPNADESASFYAYGKVIRTSPNRDLIGAEGVGLQKSQPVLSF